MRRKTSQRGATLLEAALICLLFFTLIFITMGFARALNVYHAITDAAREGARYAVAPFPGSNTLPSQGQVQSFVQNYLNADHVKNASITGPTQVVQMVNGVPLTFTEVDVSAPFSFPAFQWSFTLSTRAVMRNETN